MSGGDNRRANSDQKTLSPQLRQNERKQIFSASNLECQKTHPLLPTIQESLLYFQVPSPATYFNVYRYLLLSTVGFGGLFLPLPCFY